MTSSVSFDLNNENETEAVGQVLAQCLVFPMVFTFSGSLGAGKTTLIRACLRALHITGPIKSPTFSIVESYVLPNEYHVHHFDLYRIEDESELELIGIRDYFESLSFCCIEWPERAPNLLAHLDVSFILTTPSMDSRRLDITAHSSRGSQFLSNFMREYA